MTVWILNLKSLKSVFNVYVIHFLTDVYLTDCNFSAFSSVVEVEFFGGKIGIKIERTGLINDNGKLLTLAFRLPTAMLCEAFGGFSLRSQKWKEKKMQKLFFSRNRLFYFSSFSWHLHRVYAKFHQVMMLGITGREP